MSLISRTSSFPLSRNGQTVLAAAASVLIGAALGLRAWSATSGLAPAALTGACVAVFSMALFRIALDGSFLVRRLFGQPRFDNETAFDCDSSVRIEELDSRPGSSPLEQDEEPDFVVLELPTSEWKKPLRSTTLVRTGMASRIVQTEEADAQSLCAA